MKKYIAFFLLSLFTLTCFAQEAIQHIYEYDDAGNRISRTHIVLSDRSLRTDDSGTNSWDSSKSPYYEEFIGRNMVKVFPNPTQGLVTLQFEQPVENSYYQLNGLEGQLLSEGRISTTTITIDLTEYRTGVYLLTIALNNEKETWKIIKK